MRHTRGRRIESEHFFQEAVDFLHVLQRQASELAMAFCQGLLHILSQFRHEVRHRSQRIEPAETLAQPHLADQSKGEVIHVRIGGRQRCGVDGSKANLKLVRRELLILFLAKFLL